MSKNITIQEAIKRIDEFAIHHAIKDLPNSAYTVESFDMAIEALQMRIPKEADIYVNIYDESIRSYCPQCHNEIDSYTKYCPSCGQKIFYNYNRFLLNGQKFEVNDSLSGIKVVNLEE